MSHSNLKIEIYHPPQTKRIVVGAGVFVVGVILFRSYSEALGLFLLLSGIAIGIRRSIGPIFAAIICLTVFALILAYMYATVSDYYRFEDWVKEQWWAILYAAYFILWPLYSSKKQSADAWADLQIDYSGGPEMMGKQHRYEAVSGYLKVDETLLFVYVSATDLGIFVVRENRGHVFFPWHKVESIRVSRNTLVNADVEISRRIILPLKLNLPWHDRLTTAVPPTVHLLGV